MLANLASHAYYETFNYFVIVINSIILMINDPQMKDAYTLKCIDGINLGCSIVFTVEVILKIIAMGLYKGKNTYLKSDGFNVFDFVLWLGIASSLIL
jgi:hypothetical protein